MFDFPASPVNGQTFAPAGGPVYTFQNGVWLASVAGVQVPVGTIIYVPAITAPANFTKLNGALLNRVAYAALWAFAQASGNIVGSDGAWTGNEGAFSPGDGSTTFRIPDDRGVFPRGFDDGRGLDAGRVMGAYQGDTYLNHSHTANALPNHSHGSAGATAYVSGPAFADAVGMVNRDDSSATKFTTSVSAGTPSINASTTGGTETRPKNVARLACIRFQ
jgi:microcystin-dependent protein